MTTKDEYERTLSYGESALSYLKGNRTPAFPRNYELWYTYSAGFNRELNKAINDSLRRFGRLSAEQATQYYDEYLSPVRLGDRVGEVSTRVSTELDDIVSLLERSGSSLGSYGQSLRRTASGLGKAESVEQIRDVVQTMITATSNMESQNADLEKQLTDSRKQIEELQESLEAIRYESLTDQLTGLANRKHFDQSLERAVEQSSRRGEPLALLMCDIDHFKLFNDTYGHQTGDQVLRLVGAAIKASVKGRDLAARYGGEEFSIILPETALQEAVTVGNHIRAAVTAKELIKRSTGESLGRITMSGGVALLRAGDTADSLVERADACLYASKHAGRNRITPEDDPIVAGHHSAVA